MRAVDFFAAAEKLPFADLDAIIDGGGLVVVAPHPDDESLGCGGLIATARAQDRDVRLVVISDGTGSHAGSLLYPASKLRDLREAETRAAGARLGLEQDAITFLRLPDRLVPTDGPEAAGARDAIVAVARDCIAGAVCVSWLHDPHCDHYASARLVVDARSRLGTARIFFYPIWGWTLPPQTEVGTPPRGARFDVSAVLNAKAAAIAAHVSQTTNLIDDDPDGFRLTSDMLANFARPYEILLDAENDS